MKPKTLKHPLSPWSFVFKSRTVFSFLSDSSDWLTETMKANRDNACMITNNFRIISASFKPKSFRSPIPLWRNSSEWHARWQDESGEYFSASKINNGVTVIDYHTWIVIFGCVKGSRLISQELSSIYLVRTHTNALNKPTSPFSIPHRPCQIVSKKTVSFCNCLI